MSPHKQKETPMIPRGHRPYFDGLKRRNPFPDGPSSLPPQRSLRFGELLDKFGNEPHALSEHELNELVCECMFHGDVKALRSILETRPMPTLDISRPADERAWWTLLAALPEPCSVQVLKLRDQQFTSATGALFLEAAGRMDHLEGMRLHSCNWTIPSGELTCPPLPNLQELHVEKTENPLPLLDEIFKASQVSAFKFSSHDRMADEDHASLANLLVAQCNAKLRDLALRDLQARDQTLEGLFAHYTNFLEDGPTALRYLDFSGNTLGPSICTDLAAVLQDATLHGLTLAGCWPKNFIVSGCPAIAGLISLPSLVKLDLSHNDFPWSQQSIFVPLMWCKNLQHLDLHGSTLDNSNLSALSYSLRNLKIRSLCLPNVADRLYGHFLKVAGELLFLRVDGLDRLHAQMSEEFSWLYPDYLALKTRVDDNWRRWSGAVPLGVPGMTEVLRRMGGGDQMVPPDIARLATRFAVEGNGADTESLSLLNKSARPKVPVPETRFPVDKN